MKLIGKCLFAAAKWFWPDLAQWEEEAYRAFMVAGSAARKLHVSMYRNEIEPRAEYESLVAGMGSLLKLGRGPGAAFRAGDFVAPPSGEKEGERGTHD